MNVEAFRTEMKLIERRQTFFSANEYNAFWERARKASAPEHVGKSVSEYMSDRVDCSCGWVSLSFWDGLEFAWNEWRKHVAKDMGLKLSTD